MYILSSSAFPWLVMKLHIVSHLLTTHMTLAVNCLLINFVQFSIRMVIFCFYICKRLYALCHLYFTSLWYLLFYKDFQYSQDLLSIFLFIIFFWIFFIYVFCQEISSPHPRDYKNSLLYFILLLLYFYFYNKHFNCSRSYFWV